MAEGKPETGDRNAVRARSEKLGEAHFGMAEGKPET
jgi:hypothetical protein